MRIKELKDEKKIDKLALLHKKAFPDFFLTQLGLRFLKLLYKGYLDDKDSGIIVAEVGDRVVGFIAYSNDYPQFFKKLIKQKIIWFALYSILAFFRHPAYAKRLLGAFGKSASVEKKERYVELASICVEPHLSGRGIGSALINYMKSKVDFKTYAYINLETDAGNNEAVNQFYIKNGFILARTYTTAEGRRMNEYQFKPGVNR